MAPWKSSAVVYHSRNSPVELKEFEIDQLGPSQVLVKTEYASINPADVKLKVFAFTSSEKHTLKDFAGTVVALGKNVQGKLSVGEKVWGSIHWPSPSSYVGSYTVADFDKDVVAPLPNSLTLEQGATIGVVYGTAFLTLERASKTQKFGPDTSILILGGATSVGSYAIQLAKKYFHIGNVVVTASSKSAEYVRDLGADEVIDYNVPDLRAKFKSYAKRAGRKFDAIIDTVGGYDAIAVHCEILKPASQGSGYVSIMGDAGPAKTYTETMFNAVLAFPVALFRIFFGKYYGINYHLFMWSKGDWVDSVPVFFGTPGVKVLIDSVYPVSDIKEAWNKVDSTKARGKVVVKF